MIAVDSNVLVRLFVDDEPYQHQKAVHFFSERPPRDAAYVNLVVLVEVVWLLSQRFGYARDQVLDVLTALVSNAGFIVERDDLVVKAIGSARSLGTGFADQLIQGLNAEAGCSMTMTFDKMASRRIPGMELLK